METMQKKTKKTPRGRPKKVIEIVSPVEPIIRKRGKHENMFASNIVENLNDVLSNLRMEYCNIKTKEVDLFKKKD